MALGRTEAFPDLGEHCRHNDCHQLNFLPFTCQGCQNVFCLEHKSFKSHACKNSNHNNRKVVVCETCSMSIETTYYVEQEEETILEKHLKLGIECYFLDTKHHFCDLGVKGFVLFGNLELILVLWWFHVIA
ncbi:hypothetical protein V8G54_000800 [Vigna mungo]|uniref:AN1-type domain-containing protein n=1 Tax=Vigna mungo TaxID=3915 RepID=A0AAQ3P582_VIGMU